MKYFNDCRTAEQVRSRFTELAKKLHPDCGGDAAEFRNMMDEYRKAFNMYKDIHTTAEGETYESREKTTETPETFSDIIEKVIHFTDVKIEIIGSWIWLSGNTMIYKDQIKEIGFWWSKTKKAWYYNGSDKRTTKRGHYNNLDQLRNVWTSTEVKTEKQERIA